MAAVVEVDQCVISKCLDLCQALENKGTPFTFSITIGSAFTLSLDTRGKEEPSTLLARKKTSPSTMRRNARRKEEYMKRKAEETSNTSETTKDKPEAQGSWRSEDVSVNDTRSVKLKLVKNSSEIISQLDGHDEVETADAAVNTLKPETKDTGVQTNKAAPILENNEATQTNPKKTKRRPKVGVGTGPSLEELFGPDWHKTKV